MLDIRVQVCQNAPARKTCIIAAAEDDVRGEARRLLDQQLLGILIARRQPVSTIAVPDMLYQGSLITADTYRPLEVYTVVALIYFALLFPATRLVQWWEGRLARR